MVLRESTDWGRTMKSVKRILVVDDEKGVRSLLEFMLDSLGYEAELASDGAEALEKLDSDIDLVLLDVMMPEWMVWRSPAESVSARIAEIFLLLLSPLS